MCHGHRHKLRKEERTPLFSALCVHVFLGGNPSLGSLSLVVFRVQVLAHDPGALSVCGSGAPDTVAPPGSLCPEGQPCRQSIRFLCISTNYLFFILPHGPTCCLGGLPPDLTTAQVQLPQSPPVKQSPPPSQPASGPDPLSQAVPRPHVAPVLHPKHFSESGPRMFICGV